MNLVRKHLVQFRKLFKKFEKKLKEFPEEQFVEFKVTSWIKPTMHFTGETPETICDETLVGSKGISCLILENTPEFVKG